MIANMIRRMQLTPTMRSLMTVTGPRQSFVVTRRGKPDKRYCRQEFVVTVGSPNYRGRALIKRAKRHGFDYPLQDVRVYRKPK